jgi:hypothetical protein
MLRNSRLHYLPLDPSTGMVSTNFGGSSASSQSSLSAPVPPVNPPQLPNPLHLAGPVLSLFCHFCQPPPHLCVCGYLRVVSSPSHSAQRGSHYYTPPPSACAPEAVTCGHRGRDWRTLETSPGGRPALSYAGGCPIRH